MAIMTTLTALAKGVGILGTVGQLSEGRKNRKAAEADMVRQENEANMIASRDQQRPDGGADIAIGTPEDPAVGLRRRRNGTGSTGSALGSSVTTGGLR